MPSLPFDVVVFDLDGTLVDSAADLGGALNHALFSLGRSPITINDVRQMVGHGARELLRRGLAATGSVDAALIDTGLSLLIAHYRLHLADHTRAYGGVERALDMLGRSGVRLAVCTNKLEGLARSLVDALGWSRHFAAIVGGDTLPQRKPDAAPILRAVADAGGGRAIFVGDSISDTEASRAAGIPCIAVTFGFSDRPPEQLGATALIDHFDQLLPTLERLG
jgi:phosphoglycolate phosphatase